MLQNLTSTENALLSLVSNALFDAPLSLPEKLDWKKVADEAMAQAVLPLAFYRQTDILRESWPDGYSLLQRIVSNSIKVDYNHSHLHRLMSDAGVPYVTLKGCASAFYYPQPIYRSMGDVDFLVAQADLERVGKVLEADGFTQLRQKHNCHIVYRKPGAHFEMHFEPPGIPEKKAGELVREYLKDIFAESVEIKTDTGSAVIPGDFHHGLILLLHTYHHLTGEGVGLRHLCDWAVFANSLSDTRFKEIFEEKLKSVGLWRFAQLLTQLAVFFLGMPEKRWAMENVDRDLLNKMISDIFAGGNFGCKDKNRSQETMMISSRGKNGVGNSSMAGQMIKSVNSAIYLKWPASKRFKILLPFGWVFYGTRYLIRVMTGKRQKINVSSTVRGAKRRRELYKEFHLYETNRKYGE